MSTYYFLVCEDHREHCDAVSRSAGGLGPLGDCKNLPYFAYKHRECRLSVWDEHRLFELEGTDEAIPEFEGPWHEEAFHPDEVPDP